VEIRLEGKEEEEGMALLEEWMIIREAEDRLVEAEALRLVKKARSVVDGAEVVSNLAEEEDPLELVEEEDQAEAGEDLPVVEAAEVEEVTGAAEEAEAVEVLAEEKDEIIYKYIKMKRNNLCYEMPCYFFVDQININYFILNACYHLLKH
jgi:hypothetical protein